MTPTVQNLLILLPIAYLMGSVPFGLIVGLAKGVDPRKAGSGNIGATNVGRLLGGRYFGLVFTLDFLKGLVPSLAASWVVHYYKDPASASVYLLWLGVGFATIVGHMFSVFLKFRGGKGVATSAGVMVGIFPDYTLAAVVVLAVWGVSFATSRIISLSSIIGALAFPVVYVAIALIRGQSVFGERWPMLAFAVLVAVMVVVKHRSNIARLRAGTEARFTAAKKKAA
jgi:glycerol-3-phosphate acyltransferase PlsY